jgi:hypothetical protein
MEIIPTLTSEEASDKIEIKVVPLGASYLVQVSSDIFRGMWVMDSDIEIEDIQELTELIFNFIEQITMTGSPNEIGQ